MSGYTTNQAPIISIQGTWPTNKELQGKDGNASYVGVKKLQDILADFIQKVSQAMTNFNQSGTTAQMPPAGQFARQYFAIDTNILYVDNGTSWIAIN